MDCFDTRRTLSALSSFFRRQGRARLRPVLLFTAASILISPALTFAQDAYPDRLQLRLGYAFIFSADTDITYKPVAGLGATIDFQDVLGADSNSSGLRIDTRYRFNPKHSLGFSWYSSKFDGDNVTTQEITIDDKVIDAGATTQTEFKLSLFRLLYNYSFYHTDQVELAFSPGLYITRTELSLDAQGTIEDSMGMTIASSSRTDVDVSLPLPSLGVFMSYDITPKLMAELRSDFFYLKVGSFEGSMFEFFAGLEYRVHKYFALGAAYDRLQVGATSNKDDSIDFNHAQNLVYLYGTFYVFDTPL